MQYFLFVFPNTHSAIAAQKHLEGKVRFSVMPTLREISNSCGISLRIKEPDFKTSKNILEQAEDIESFRIFDVVSEKGKTSAEEIL